MTLKVPYISKELIERCADLLLLDYKLAHGLDEVLPIPVEKILEQHLGLTLNFDDLHTSLGIPRGPEGLEVLGALYAQRKEVFIDQSLDPDEHPELEGRYRFTVAHEIGHWQLHKKLLLETGPNAKEDTHGNEPPVICRISEEHKRIEWQANHFASSLLMPRRVLDVCWHERFSRRTPLVYEVWENCSEWTNPPTGWLETVQLPSRLTNRFDPRAVSYFFYRVSRVLAPMFRVSHQAMELRLRQLGLLCLERPERLFSATS